ncbi:DUF4020 domain-containing protein [Opitutus terrae]|uniref:DUF4020 domain-containing protein n=1 Tax=Opitutus terrae (strain DSM 11246 / JCM 15787 / PB90-1) TaxID=452637 RepID=B1ZQ15_OPITP|nr:DUF4020 domain-containing protein [Opitutus terrae]ACB77734.1 hypothetical protein Oter_4463 [Opitutus terrae PB90-1]
MLFDTLDIPESLLAAQDEGKLVVFAGAGVSMGTPSNLPDFAALAELIAQRPLTDLEKSRLDHFLGELKAEGRDVHSLAVEALNRPSSRHTRLHEEIVRLFERPEHVRIVTTNFDPHFTTVVRSVHPALPIYSAPALPRGGDFHGLVYLHGAASGPARDLVLTDEDFGRAYLTEGWARAFLEQLFSHYYVLFVGYTLTDPPAHYMARGLPTEPQPRRFAIIHEEPARWRRLGVGVIPFTVGAGNDFSSLTAGITRWAQVTRGSNFWIEDQIIQLLARPDPMALTPEEANLLEWSLAHDRSLPYFVRNARGLPWVEWLESRRLLVPYFDHRAAFDHWRQRQIAAWIADQLLEGPHERSFELIRRLGGRFSRELQRQLVMQLGDVTLPVEWTFLLVREVESSDQDAHYVLGKRLHVFVEHNLPAFWALFRHCTAPRFMVDAHGFGERGSPAHLRVALAGDASVLWSVWNEAVVTRFAEIARPMLGLLLVQLESAAELARSINGEADFIRQVTAGRTRLARMDPDHHHESEPNVLIDMLAQVVAHLAKSPGGLAEAEIQGWLHAPGSILRRLGLHALAESTETEGAKKIAWLTECVARFAPDSLEHRLAVTLLASLTTPARAETAVETAVVPAAPQGLPPLADLLAMDSARLTRVLRVNRIEPVDALARLRELDERTRQNPALSEHVLWASLLARVSWRRLPPLQRDALITILQRPFALAAHVRDVLRCLFSQDPLEKDAREAEPPASAAQKAQLFAMSCRIWEAIRDQEMPLTPAADQTDWISLALNDGVGTYHLVRFWMQYVSLQPPDHANPTLPTEVAPILADICTRETEVARRARAVLVQDIRFVMARDPAWTTANMVVLFDFDRIGDEAWVAWRPFLDHGGLSRPLALAMLPHYRAAQPRMLRAEEEVIGHYLGHVATIMVHVRPAETAAWLQALLPALSERERLRWARLAARDSEGMPDQAQRELWDAWLGAYWRDRRAGRLGGVTLSLTSAEAAIMAGWLCALPEVFAEALELVMHSPAPNFEHEIFPWRELRKSSLPVRAPVGVVALIEFLLRNMEVGRVSHESVSEIADALPRLAILRAPLLRVAEVMHGHSWVPARDFRAKIEREFPLSQ